MHSQFEKKQTALTVYTFYVARKSWEGASLVNSTDQWSFVLLLSRIE